MEQILATVTICLFIMLLVTPVIGMTFKFLVPKLFVCTETRKSKNLLYSIHIRPNTYVPNDFLTATHSCTAKYFWKKLCKKFVVHIFTLLLASFAFNLVNYSRHSESLNIRKNSEIDDIFLRWRRFVDFQTHFKDSLCGCALNKWPLWAQKMPKEA